MKYALIALSLSVAPLGTQQALGWGDDGHKTIGLIAQNYLKLDVRLTIEALPSADPDGLTRHDIGLAELYLS